MELQNEEVLAPWGGTAVRFGAAVRGRRLSCVLALGGLRALAAVRVKPRGLTVGGVWSQACVGRAREVERLHIRVTPRGFALSSRSGWALSGQCGPKAVAMSLMPRPDTCSEPRR